MTTHTDESPGYAMARQGGTIARPDMAWQEKHIPAVNLLGFQLHPGTLEDYLGLVQAAIRERVSVRVLYHNLHSLHEYFRSEQLRQYYRGSVVLVDGMPLIGLLKLGGHAVDREHRLTYVDFIWPLLQRACDNGWRVFVLGQSPETLSAALEKIRERLPGLAIAGHHGYFDSTAGSLENQEVIDQINTNETDLLLVGMGTPVQERWIHDNAALLHSPAILASGACMEYVAGAVQSPPRWMGRCGLEWSFRLLENPRRFAHRYLVEPWVLAAILMRNFLLGSRA